MELLAFVFVGHLPLADHQVSCQNVAEKTYALCTCGHVYNFKKTTLTITSVHLFVLV